MTNDKLNEPVSILLSRDELLLALNLLQAETIPGLDGDPLGELNADGRTLASIVVERGLRARELARLDENGELSIHSSLLTAVGVCAYSNNTVFVYHWPGDQETPVRFFGHVRGNDIVAHTRPEDVLHLFTLLPSGDDLVDRVLQVCEFGDVPSPSVHELSMSEDDFGRVRELASQGETDAAKKILRSQKADDDAAEALIATFSGSPRVSILQTLTQQDNEAVHKRDFTIVQSDQHAWFIAPSSSEADTPPLVVKSASRSDVAALLSDLL